ncbi:MAG: CAP domain-containing protein [bacterium]
MKKYFFFFFSVFIFSGCDIGEKGYNYDDFPNYDGNNSVDNEMTEYMEKPDSDYGLGGGGAKKDKDEPVTDDEEKPDDFIEDPDKNDIVEDGVYYTEPNVGKCDPGDLNDKEKSAVLKRLNYIRSLHGLPPVVYKSEDDYLTAECALVISANKKLSHTPESNWKCYSQDALEGCNKSNIFIQWGTNALSLPSTSIVDAFMTDENVETLGHRRWFIDPWLAHISFGRVDDTKNNVLGSAIKVINDAQQSSIPSSVKFVAYPFEDYPSKLYNDNVMMSFSLVYDRVNKWNNNKVSFASAAIAIKDPNNKTMKITGMKFDNEGYGIPNNIRWFAQGIESGVKYDVVITNVKVDAVFNNYSYWFELKK